jgi:ribosome recycling factor
MIEDIQADAAERMVHAIEHTQQEFGSVRTGRASPAIVERIRVDYYGSEVPLQQLAGFSVPEARLLVISPYDKGSIGAIEKSIREANLGLSPSSDGNVLRLAFPQLTEERRKELVRVVRNMAEDGRIAVRNVRRSARQDLEELEKEKMISRDDLARAEADLDKVTQRHIEQIDELLSSKEHELLEI